MPISYDNVKSLTYSEKKNGKVATLPVPTEMLYIYNEKGKYDYYVVELLPDEEYLKKIEKKKVKLFNKREYSGYFFIKDWNDAPKEGWYMKNGKVVRQLSPTTIKKNGRLMGCDWFTRFHFSFGCVTGGGGNGGGDVIIFGTSFVIQGNDPSAGPSLAFTLPLPEGHACAYNQWQFTEADVFIDCNFDGGVPDPMEDFPFIPYLNGPGNAGSYVVWGTVAFVEYLELGFALNIQERNFYASMSWLVPQAMNNRFAAKDAIDYFYCVDADYFNGNAFKHAYWSALNTWAFGADVARTMGQLHEVGSSNLNREMDLHNNELGISIALMLDPSVGEDVLKQEILNSIAQGNGKRTSLYGDNTHFAFTFDTDATGRCN